MEGFDTLINFKIYREYLREINLLFSTVSRQSISKNLYKNINIIQLFCLRFDHNFQFFVVTSWIATFLVLGNFLLIKHIYYSIV